MHGRIINITRLRRILSAARPASAAAPARRRPGVNAAVVRLHPRTGARVCELVNQCVPLSRTNKQAGRVILIATPPISPHHGILLPLVTKAQLML